MSKPNSSSQKKQAQDADTSTNAEAQDNDPRGAAQEELPQPDTEVIVAELQQAQAKAGEYWDQLLRTRAELENLHRRSQKDLENAHKYALEKFLLEFLPVIDSLALGVAASRDSKAEVAKLREGMELTLNQLQALFDKFKIIEINPIGEKFNPEYHQAMASQESTDAEPNTVLTVYQRGYLLNDRLLRPALVVVAGAPQGGQGAGKFDESA
jgi:molecular chaperone GrpE